MKRRILAGLLAAGLLLGGIGVSSAEAATQLKLDVRTRNGVTTCIVHNRDEQGNILGLQPSQLSFLALIGVNPAICQIT